MTPNYSKHNDAYAEMARNAGTLRTVKHTYNVIGFVYIAFCGWSLLMNLPDLLSVSANGNQLRQLFDGVIFKLLLFYYGYFACYKHNSLYALIAVIVQLTTALVDMAICGFKFMNPTFLAFVEIILIAAMAGATVVNNKKYAELEVLPGFPYFNQRFEEQKMDSRQYDIKSEFTQTVEQYRKTESAEMKGFGDAAPVNEPEKPKTSGNNMMDSL